MNSDWAPYTSGNWAYEPYYGWTWVSYEPWGWAPYHYGRWFLYGTRWAWWPGPVYAGYRPVWGPAYVNFFGWGPNWGVGFGWGFGFGFGWGWGHFGWLPCGPGDWYHPWWGGFRGRFGVVNVHNTVIVNNYHNGFAPLRRGGFSTVHGLATNPRLQRSMGNVDARDFGKGVTGRSPSRGITAAAARNAGSMSGNMPVTPTKASLRTSSRPASRSSIPAHAGGQHFYTTHTPAAVHSFNDESRGVQQAMQMRQQQVSHMANSYRSAAPGRNASVNSAANKNVNGAGQPRGETPSRMQTAPNRSEPASHNAPVTAHTPPSNTPQGWQRFAHESQSSRAAGQANYGRSSEYNRPNEYGNRGSYNSAPRYGESGTHYGASGLHYGASSYGSRPGSSYSRPPLDMSKPIVNPHSNGGYNYGGHPSAPPSYGGHPFTRPLRRQSWWQSWGSSAPHGGASSGGGGHPSGGGGGHTGGGGHGR